MRKAILIILIILLGNFANALEIKREAKQIPPLSVHDFQGYKEPKKFKIKILPLIDFDSFTFSGFKIEIIINDMPNYSDKGEFKQME